MTCDAAMDVVSIDEHEWRTVKDLRLRALADSPKSFGSSLAREVDYGETDWQALVRRGQWFRAVDSGGSIGMAAGLQPKPDARNRVHMISFWVDPASRGHGVAEALLEAVCEWARSIGAHEVGLWVADESAAARRFYRRMGFEGTGTRQPLPSNPSIGEELLRLEL